MKNIKLYKTQDSFNTEKEELNTPWVALTDDNGEVHYSVDDEQEDAFAYVDLGLPSGLKWATMNVGATSETDLGTQFAWGETETKDDFQEMNYKYFALTPTYYEWTKYCQADGLTTLEPEDDTAHVVMGGKWRMPTKDEMQELLDNTNYEFVIQDDVTYVRFTSKTDSSKSMILPTTYNSTYGHLCNVWSSSLSTQNNEPFAIDIMSKGGTPIKIDAYMRCRGHYVRAVKP